MNREFRFLTSIVSKHFAKKISIINYKVEKNFTWIFGFLGPYFLYCIYSLYFSTLIFHFLKFWFIEPSKIFFMKVK